MNSGSAPVVVPHGRRAGRIASSGAAPRHQRQQQQQQRGPRSYAAFDSRGPGGDDDGGDPDDYDDDGDDYGDYGDYGDDDDDDDDDDIDDDDDDGGAFGGGGVYGPEEEISLYPVAPDGSTADDERSTPTLPSVFRRNRSSGSLGGSPVKPGKRAVTANSSHSSGRVVAASSSSSASAAASSSSSSRSGRLPAGSMADPDMTPERASEITHAQDARRGLPALIDFLPNRGVVNGTVTGYVA
jgi:hypothetical protein